ncbi:putative cyclic nucleotide-gated ion channel 20, chloroplastic isoform X1 [Apium graveolens]|uniref:putative cyclic nucleotide-gated ion channel 20, chloroplastic isoform X1 n=1 Tax=Apium graveolens TaxID=4045 RepID=UPI003D794A64
MNVSDEAEVHMQMDKSAKPKFRSSSTSMRSASISIPMHSLSSSDVESHFLGHSGPLHSERNISYMQMSDPVYANVQNDKCFQPTRGAMVSRAAEKISEKYPSVKGVLQNDRPLSNHVVANENLLRAGQLGMCNDPYCTTCPTYFEGQRRTKKVFSVSDQKQFLNINYQQFSIPDIKQGDAKGWAWRTFSSLYHYIPGVMNPHAKIVQFWNKFFVISCLFAVFLDPLFFFLLSVKQEHKCIVFNEPMTKVLITLRSLTDFIYLLHMLLQFRLAYVAPESRVVGSGDLVDHPRRIALNYLRGHFLIDFFVVLPLPQIIIWLVLKKFKGSSGANYAKNFLRATILIQYIPRLYRILPLLAGQTASGFIFESAWANFVINLLTFVLSGHVVGSCWYLFGLQRVNQCLRDACLENWCIRYIDCGQGNENERFQENPVSWTNWTNNANANACFGQGSFSYGIYTQTVGLTTESALTTRYMYSLFWGFQQISTLAGNLTPSYFVGEVLFTMAIIGLGLLLFALLIGNMQNFLQALGRRRLELSLRRRDVEQWMSHRRLPEELRRQIRESERYNWAATRGVDETMLLENLPEDLQRDIRRHLFKFVNKVRIFSLMDEAILDAMRERLKQKTYIKGSRILVPGGLIDKMVFIVRGKLESIGEDKNIVPLSEGDVCGEDLLTWCLEHSSVNKDGKRIRIPGHKLLSNRMARCLTNVEAFILRAADLEEVTSLFSRLLRNPRVQGALRYESPYWRCLAATRIQVAWRYRKKTLSRATTVSSAS